MTSRNELDPADLAEALGHDPVPLLVDVRSPAEYARDHLPGAVNLPVLDNDQRSDIGTEYVQGSAFDARRRGAAHVARAVADHLEQSPELRDPARPVITYCARGGQRSSSFAHILSEVGFDSRRLRGGYKSVRRQIREDLESAPAVPAVVVHGPSGCDKTRLLPSVARHLGWNWIDLERCADHRGSRFGGIGRQPVVQKQFENNLWNELRTVEGPVLLEGESRRIGNCFIPPAIWDWMSAGRHVWIELPRDERARILVEDYFGSPADPDLVREFRTILQTLKGELSTADVDRLSSLLDDGDHLTVALDLLEGHFDPHYRKHVGEAVVHRVDDVDAAIEFLCQELGSIRAPAT